MPDLTVQFDFSPLESLDQLALLASQGYNLANAGDWFGEFRGGLYALGARLYGVQRHYFEVHAWLPRVRIPTDIEYHLASIFFHMDSALECFTFALNALGWATMPAAFRDVTDAKALRRISPVDVLGDPTRTPPALPLQGYAQVYPTVAAEWHRDAQIIARIRDLHDVSKHRQTIFVGGQARSDPPYGFYESLGIPDEAHLRAQLWPMAEIVLKQDPKLPAAQRIPGAMQQRELLEDLVPAFATLMKKSGVAALGDARAKVPLKEKHLRN